MEQQAASAAQWLADHYIRGLRGDFVDGGVVVRAALAGYLAGSGVPTDQAVQMVEQMVAKGLVTPASRNPLYHGLPWMVAGPASGVPYYAE